MRALHSGVVVTDGQKTVTPFGHRFELSLNRPRSVLEAHVRCSASPMPLRDPSAPRPGCLRTTLRSPEYRSARPATWPAPRLHIVGGSRRPRRGGNALLGGSGARETRMTPSSFHQNGYWMASELYVPLAGLIPGYPAFEVAPVTTMTLSPVHSDLQTSGADCSPRPRSYLSRWRFSPTHPHFAGGFDRS